MKQQLAKHIRHTAVFAISLYEQNILPVVFFETIKGGFNMKYMQLPGFLLKDIAGDKILIARGTHAIEFAGAIVFNEPGTFMWDLLKEPQTPKELSDLLVKKYNIDAKTALNDAEKFLNKGVEEGILQKVD